MFLFNWKKIYEEAQGSSVAVLEIIEMVYYKKVPYNKYDSLYKYRDVNFSGDSFLLEPGILLEMSFRYDPKEVAVYIALAARRKLSDYIAFGRKTLSVRHAPNLINHIETNRILYIKDGQIHFVYEEAQRRR
jgi:hypothetical protein